MYDFYAETTPEYTCLSFGPKNKGCSILYTDTVNPERLLLEVYEDESLYFELKDIPKLIAGFRLLQEWLKYTPPKDSAKQERKTIAELDSIEVLPAKCFIFWDSQNTTERFCFLGTKQDYVSMDLSLIPSLLSSLTSLQQTHLN